MAHDKQVESANKNDKVVYESAGFGGTEAPCPLPRTVRSAGMITLSEVEVRTQDCVSNNGASPTGAPPHALLETLDPLPHKPTRQEKTAGLESFSDNYFFPRPHSKRHSKGLRLDDPGSALLAKSFPGRRVFFWACIEQTNLCCHSHHHNTNERIWTA